MADLRRVLRRREAADLTVEPLIDTVAEFAGAVADAVGKDYNLTNSRAERFLKGYMAERVAMINDTTRKALQKALRDPDPRAAVREVFRHAWDVRAPMIAETECLPAGTSVDSAVVGAAFRRRYDGDMVEIITKGGRQFSATPNHPMLTLRGWVGAGALTEFDDLVCHNGQQNLMPHMHIDRGPTKIAEIFDALTAIGISERQSGRRPDFHGDGIDGEVYVARPHGQLRIGAFAPILEPLSKDLFAPSDRARAPLCRQCGRLLAVDHTACFGGGSDCEAGGAQPSDHSCTVDPVLFADLCRRHLLVIFGHRGIVNVGAEIGGMTALGVKQRAGSGAAAIGDAGGFQRLVNEAVVGTDNLGCCRPAQAAQIEFDRLASLRVYRFAGHVFNLATSWGYFGIEGGVYTGNTVRASNWAAIDAGKWVTRLDRKTWASQQDARVRFSHTGLHGQTVDWNDDFTSPSGAKAKFPGGFGLPEEDINCRCAALPARADIVADFDEDPVALYDNLREPFIEDLTAAWRKVFDAQQAAALAELE